MKQLPFFLFLVIVAAGCRTPSAPESSELLAQLPGYDARSGDLMTFLVEQVRKAGGQVANPEAADSVITEWYFKGDDDGFQILLPGDEKESLVRALTETFGEPLLRDEYPHLVYETRSIGVAMMIDLESDPIHIICLRKGAIP